MMHRPWGDVATRGLLFILMATALCRERLNAQDSVRTLNLGFRDDSVEAGGVPDSILRDAVERFNAPGTSRTHGTQVIAAGSMVQGDLGVHRGTLRVEGTIRGNVIVINGDILLRPTGRVSGSITVLGGRIIVQPGAVHGGTRYETLTTAWVSVTPERTLRLSRRPRGLIDYTTAQASITAGPVRATLGVEAAPYNRVEGLPVMVSPSLLWRPDDITSLQLRLTGIARTAGDPSDLRSDFGWRGELELARLEPAAIRVTVDASSLITPMVDQAYSPLESGIAAFVARRDYRDWYNSRSAGIVARWRPRAALELDAGYRWSRERTVRSVDAFSLLRADDSWRPNPIIDDGHYRAIGIGLAWDTRDDASRATTGWMVRAAIRRTMSDDLTPVSLPGLIRDNMPTTGYGSTDIEFDFRSYLRLNPSQGVHLRLAGGGWLGGDPLTVQRRRSMGGADPLAGYEFREVTCDRRRRPDNAEPALCDRRLLAQVEFRRSVDLGINARVAGISLGLEEADIVVLADAGTAWVAGDGPGRVPSGRIQDLSEWLADVGIGLDGGLFGVYVAKPLTGDGSPRFSVRLRRRF